MAGALGRWRQWVAAICGAVLTLGAVGVASAPAALAGAGRHTADTDFLDHLGQGFVGSTVWPMVETPDGGLLVAGDFTGLGDGPSPQRLVRLNADGTPNTAFNERLGTGFNGFVRSLVATRDGKYLVGGTFTSVNGDTSAPTGLVRLNGDGSIDTTFSANLGSGFANSVFAVLETSDGGILVGGWFSALGGSSAVPNHLLKLTSEGHLDTEFNSHLGSGLNSSVYSLMETANREIFVTGAFTSVGGDSSIPNHVVRLHEDGTLDTTFNSRLGTGFGSEMYSVTQTASGDFLVSGSFASLNGDPTVPSGVVRINADGTLDEAFNAALGTGFASSMYVARESSDGGIYVGGFFTTLDGRPTPGRFLRLNADGTPDEAFNSRLGTGFNAVVRSVLETSDGSVLVGGNFTSFNDDSSAPSRLMRWTRASVQAGPVDDRTDPVNEPVDVTLPVSASPGRTIATSATGLPTGLTLEPETGRVTGIPTETGQFPVQVGATVLVDGTPLTDTAEFTWTIRPAAPLTLTGDPDDGTVGQTYHYAFAATGTPDPTVAVTEGAVPAGLTLSPRGVLSGTPTTAGTFDFTLTATNAVADDATLEVSVRIVEATTPATSVWIRLAHAERVPGQAQTALAGGFDPGERVEFVLASGRTDLGAATADDAGRAALTFRVPDGGSAGAHTVIATGASGTADATFTVVTPGPGPGDGGHGTPDPADDAGGGDELAWTGGPSAAWALIAAALIAAGAFLLHRRRPTRESGPPSH